MSKAGYECRKCGKIVSAKQYKVNKFCPTRDCGTYLNPRTQPRHWLFQFNPSIYNWSGRIKETQEPEQWLISQHAKLIQKGDLVVIWCSGQRAGVYALGQITTRPAKNPLNANQQKYFLNKDDIDKFRDKHSAYVEYSNIFLENPLLQETCNHDEILLSLQVIMNPQGTNFRLSHEQWERILELQHIT